VKREPASTKASRVHYPDMQSAARFPIKLPILVKSKSGANAAETENISANGVLFHVDSEMPIVRWWTSPSPAGGRGGSGADVQLDCAAAAIELHIGLRSHHVRRQRDGEVHHRTNRHFRVHVEEHAVGRDIFGLGCVGADFDFTKIGSLMGNRAALCMSDSARGWLSSMRVRASRLRGTPTASLLSELLCRHRDSRPPQIAHCSTLRGADYTPKAADKSYGIMELVGVKPCGSWN